MYYPRIMPNTRHFPRGFLLMVHLNLIIHGLLSKKTDHNNAGECPVFPEMPNKILLRKNRGVFPREMQ